jgi:hypothetical protein
MVAQKRARGRKADCIFYNCNRRFVAIALPHRKREKQHLYHDKREQEPIKKTPPRLQPTKLSQ